MSVAGLVWQSLATTCLISSQLPDNQLLSKKDFSAEANATGVVVGCNNSQLRDLVKTGVEKGTGVPPCSTIGKGDRYR